MNSDRILGSVALVVAVGMLAAATQVQEALFPNPLGSKVFPMLIAILMGISAIVILLKPEPNPEWPSRQRFGAIGFAVAVLVAYAYSLPGGGFILPTIVAASVVSYLLRPAVLPALLTGVGLSVGLFVIFKFVLKLGLKAWPNIFMS